MAASISTATATNPYYLNCSRSLRCGQSLFNITYPFLLPESPPYCGVPGYELRCDEADSTLTIKLHDKDYKVTTINKDGFLTVVDMDFLGITCPQTFTNTTINSTLFDFSDNDRNLTVYVGCLITLPIDFL
ncbi:hypothetical protein HPP92_021732 [Vanilla planifolia]|uniref:Wall-associated receptor kinase galacturonan-binding domain-containing protein n=1 Tax=Vanilla planifolia TaxID=51239 RepID=A0A835PW38_VANPL|nr:hypothetical protein HPP92_021732 [Vanilla planifolia]